MKSSLLFLSLLFFVTSCKPSPETKFTKEGVSFTCPMGWKITEEQSFYGLGHYLSIEKDGWTSSGVFSLTWLNGESDLDSYLVDLKSELKDNIIFRRSDMSFGEHYESNYNDLSSLAVDYSVTILGVAHKGNIHTLNIAGRNVTIITQGAIEDAEINLKGFEILESSFKVLEQI